MESVLQLETAFITSGLFKECTAASWYTHPKVQKKLTTGTMTTKDQDSETSKSEETCSTVDGADMVTLPAEIHKAHPERKYSPASFNEQIKQLHS